MEGTGRGPHQVKSPPGGTEVNYRKFETGQSNWASPEYTSAVQGLEPTCRLGGNWSNRSERGGEGIVKDKGEEELTKNENSIVTLYCILQFVQGYVPGVTS